MPVVIAWWLDLQLPMLSVSAGRWFSPGTPVSSTNKTDHHDIVETLLKVPLNNINQTKPILYHLLLK